MREGAAPIQARGATLGIRVAILPCAHSMPPTLSAGARLGPYIVQSALGAGGMGEVYRATDTRLNRDVALKILPDLFAQDTERLARFQREAQLLASLNHPNIGGIYGLEEGQVEAGHHVRALVLELVDGPTLAERIEAGPIPLMEAIATARQIADALSVAHEHGIVHRDLKPSNIKLRHDGAVKVLDFGLAKSNISSVPNASTDPNVFSQSPTLMSPAATQVGIILGTAAYMSPEQAKGRPVDKRADIWAFGCVLYEMLSGARAFDGDDVSDTMAGILRGEPDWQRLPAETPRVLVRLVKRCLQKDRSQRLHDIGDAKFDLQEALAPSDGASPVVAPPRSRMRRALPMIIAVVVTASSTALAAWFWRPAAPPALAKRFQVALPIGENFTSTGRAVVAVSPSGSHLVYVANQRLNLRALHELDATALPGTEGIGDMASRNPFFSPDGQSIGFWQGGQLKRIGIEGGSAVTITQAAQPFGATWHEDGFIYYGAGPNGIWRVTGTGGTPERLIEARDGESLHGPQVMPDGDHILFTTRPKATSEWDLGQIVVESVRTKERRIVVSRGRDGRLLPTGHLLYGDTGTLFAIRFDVDRLTTEGGAAAILQNVFDGGGNTGTMHVAVSRDGLMAFVRNAGATQRATLVRVDRSGREVGALTDTPIVGLAFPRISPDGSRLAAVAGGDVWIYDLTRRPPIRVTFQGGTYSPIWSPDGTRLVFESANPAMLLSVPADGSGTKPVPASPEGHFHPHGTSSDGAEILAVVLDGGVAQNTGADIVRIGPGPKFEPQIVIATPNREGFEGASLSPDRRWLAYTSTATGQIEIYVQPYPGPASPVRISPNGGTEPVWSRNGRELFYLQERNLMAVAIATQGALTFSAPMRLFELSSVVTGQPPSYDVTLDGSFVMVRSLDGPAAAPPIVVTLNWFEELKRRLP